MRVEVALLLVALVWQCGAFLCRLNRRPTCNMYGSINPWEAEEVLKLEEFKVKNGYDFAEIGPLLGRSEAACLQKYVKIVNSNRLSMSEAVQKRIIDLVVEYGENWDIICEVSDIIGSPRTLFLEESVKSFYKLYTKSFGSGPWSASEDMLLIRLINDNIANNAGGNALTSANDTNIFYANKSVASVVKNVVNVDKLRELMLNGSSDGDIQRFIVDEYQRLELSSATLHSHGGYSIEYADSVADALYNAVNDGDDDTDKLRVYATRPPPNWRNISHNLRRSSIDCRRRYCSIILNRNMEKINDVWYPGEVYSMFALVKKWGKLWTSIGAELGRTPMQCYQAFNLYQHNMQDSTDSPNGYNWITNYYKLNKRVKVWSEQEDEQLLSLVDTYSSGVQIQWSNIGKVLNRLPQQCFQRYKIVSIKNQSPQGWNMEQNEELHALVHTLGPVWTKIGVRLNRTAYSCRSAYKRFIDRMNSNCSTTALVYKMPRSRDYKYNLTSISIGNNVNSKRAWTKQDDEYLKNRVEILGRRWSSIAEDMGKSPEDIMLRYDFKLSPRKVGAWTMAEDKKLLQLMEEFGPRWSKIGQFLGRTGPQCAIRYRSTLDPRLKWKLWTPDEDGQLIDLRSAKNYNWAMISATMDRPASAVRYRYTKLIKERIEGVKVVSYQGVWEEG